MFNKDLLRYVNSALDEGCGRAVGKLYANTDEYKALCKKIEDVQKQLENDIDKNLLEMFIQFVNACENKSSYEQKYIYIQGMKDYRDIMYFIESDALDSFLLDYDFKYDI